MERHCPMSNDEIENELTIARLVAQSHIPEIIPRLPIISLFSGALGLDLGLEQAGFQIRVAVECNRFAAATIRRNRPDIPIIEQKIEQVTTEEILKAAGLEP